MPYSGEKAAKGGHSDFVRNPDIQSFLSECEYLKPPSEQEAKEIASKFIPAPKSDQTKLPKFVVASDASKSDSSISDKLPSTQLGFIKVSHVLITMAKYAELIDPKSRFVNPFKAAELHRNAQPITYVLPGSNIRYKGAKTVKDGFRHALFDQFTANRRELGNRMVLTEILLSLNDDKIIIKKCPSCNSENNLLTFTPDALTQVCPDCKETVYLTDWLRLHEGLSDFGDNSSAMTRMMNAVEHLLLGAFILELLQNTPNSLSNIAFVIDGPLAIFGEPAKLHQRLMALIYAVNEKLSKLGLEPVLIIGLQKTGAVMDHAMLLQRFLPNGVIKLIDDKYRQKYITGSEDRSANFGSETYYGQDFLFKTESGRIFNFALPYPFADKGSSGRDFSERKVEIDRYCERTFFSVNSKV